MRGPVPANVKKLSVYMQLSLGHLCAIPLLRFASCAARGALWEGAGRGSQARSALRFSRGAPMQQGARAARSHIDVV